VVSAARWLLLLLALPLAGTAGCGGCRNEAPEKKPEAEVKPPLKPKPDFDRIQVRVQPNDPQIEESLRGIKPGHWTSAGLLARANNFDFRGDLAAYSVDSQGNPLFLEHTAYRLQTARPAILPKGQRRLLDLVFFVPRGRESSRLAYQMRDARGGREVQRDEEVFTHMAAYQYYLVVLAREPTRYGYWKLLDSVRPPWGELVDKRDESYYRVLLPKITGRVPLPEQPLCWTSVAYIAWDDIDPSSLSAEQQVAMLDWLHWGGVLLVSGPQTLDLLRGSFLEPYLPATAGGNRQLTDADFSALNDAWTLPEDKGEKRPLTTVKPWLGVKLVKHADAQFLPGAENLVVERRAGRGRIVATAFSLKQRELLTWKSFDSFVNNCLLRRPPREFSERNLAVESHWFDEPHRQLDPRLVTNLRYFSRDNEPRLADKPRTGLAEDVSQSNNNPRFAQDPFDANDSGEDVGTANAAQRESGVGGWSDFNPVSTAARQSLKAAAGITIPKRQFVVWVLGLYLLVIVPLNWGVFRLLGRVEWAWAAAPVISIVCALCVIRGAEIDIGFARSETELGVIELQPGYSRAHVTRYSALYTSLSTNYDVQFDDPSALVQPFATEADFELVSGQEHATVTFHRDENVRLSGFPVSSNSTGMIHSEQMLDVGGGLSMQGADGPQPRITNGTKLTLRDVGLVRRRVTEAAESQSRSAERLGFYKDMSTGDYIRQLRQEIAQLPLDRRQRQAALQLTTRDGVDIAELSDFAKAEARFIELTKDLRAAIDERAGRSITEVAWIGTLGPGESAAIKFKEPAGEMLLPEREQMPMTSQADSKDSLNLRALVQLAQEPFNLEPGDARLVAWTEEALSGARIEPAAPQVHRAALVVANLRYGSGPPPRPDVNLRSDASRISRDNDDPEVNEPIPAAP